ncbi:MAG: hydrogenase accessory protein HypB [Gaiellales bacterium]|nr:MAG: hydrogenase accessory protein HypB [Gaiellales bacterium]
MRIEVRQNILARNDEAAAANRALLASHDVTLVNLMAAPGAGKTSVIMGTIEELRSRVGIAVIEGDIASEVDSLAIEAMDIPAIQINTGGGCHLNAGMIGTALEHLDLEALDMIIIENVGNLVCPAEFDLGEESRILITSVTEGHDKPYKYPQIFRVADAVLINKVDLLPYCDFDMARFRELVLGLNPGASLFEVSCTEERGLAAWTAWLASAVGRVG